MRKHPFKRADAVYYLDKSSKKGVSKKLKPVWSGPGLIVGCRPPNIFKVLFRNRDIKIINHDHLKPCSDQELPKWLAKEQKTITEGRKHTYCICGQPDDGEVMISCDVCYEWFHGACIGIPSSYQATRMGDYICPQCSSSD